MTLARVPVEAAHLLTGDLIAIVATVRPDGQPATAGVWVDWDGEHVLFSSPVGSRKGRNLRSSPHAAVHVNDPRSGSWLQVRGSIAEIRPDDGLAFIDRLSMRYKGVAYPVRDRDREIFVLHPEHVLHSIR